MAASLHVLMVFLLLHFLSGHFLPYAAGAKAPLWRLVEAAGIEMDRRLNRETRADSVRALRGFAVVAVMTAAGALFGYVLHEISAYPYGWIAEVLFLFLGVTAMAPLKVMRRMAACLEKRETEMAREILQSCIRENLALCDAYALVRKALEFAADSLNRSFLSPLFWYVVAGPSGLALSVIYAALHQAFGLADPRHAAFGATARFLNGAVHFIPARLTALFLALASVFVSRSNPFRALATAFKQARLYKSVYAGWPVAALAGGLGVTLGGPARYFPDYAIERGWVGPAESSARLGPEDLKRGTLLFFVFFLCVMAFSLAAFAVFEL